MALEKTLESPLGCKEIKQVNHKGNRSWIFIGRSDAETPMLWPPDAKNWLIWKDPDTGKDCRQEEKAMIEDEWFGWHHQLDGHEFEQTLGASDIQGSLSCCGPWICKELDTTKWLNWTSSVAYWTSSYLGGSSSGVISSYLFILSMKISRQEYWSGLPFLL